MKVLQLKISNYVGVKAIDITPEGNVIRVEGKNSQGKSSTIDAIWWNLGALSKADAPQNPIRHGENEAEVFVDYGEIRVTRKETTKGQYLEIRQKDGSTVKSPQTILNNLFNAISIDPEQFVSKKPKERRELLLNITGQKDKIESLETKGKVAYDKRTLVNREVDTIKGKLVGALPDETIEEVNASELYAKLKEAEKQEKTVEDMGLAMTVCETDIITAENNILNFQKQIEELQRNIKIAKTRIESCQDRHKTLRLSIESSPPSTVSAIEAEINSMDAHNAKARKVKEARALRAELVTKQKESETLTAEIKKCDSDKLALLTDAKMPLKNLSFNGDDMLIGETLFDDLSYSEQIKVSILIGKALNNDISIMRIAHGNNLDSDNTEQISKFAEKHGIQIWMECVANEPTENSIFIEDGEVKKQKKAK